MSQRHRPVRRRRPFWRRPNERLRAATLGPAAILALFDARVRLPRAQAYLLCRFRVVILFAILLCDNSYIPHVNVGERQAAANRLGSEDSNAGRLVPNKHWRDLLRPAAPSVETDKVKQLEQDMINSAASATRSRWPWLPDRRCDGKAAGRSSVSISMTSAWKWRWRAP